MISLSRGGLTGLALLASVLAPVAMPSKVYAQQNEPSLSAAVTYRSVDEILDDTNFRAICSDNYQNEIKSGKVIVFFYDTNSEVSRRLAQVFRNVYNEFNGQITFLKYRDICERPDLPRMSQSRSDEYGLKGIPAFIFYRDGKRVFAHFEGPKEGRVDAWTEQMRKTILKYLL